MVNGITICQHPIPNFDPVPLPLYQSGGSAEGLLEMKVED